MYKLYEQHACPFVRVVHGAPFSWEPVIATMDTEIGRPSVAWSPCSRFVAVEGDTTINFMDAVTLKELNTFKCTETINCLSFSPGSHLLTKLSDWELTSWDLQTGGLVSTIKLENENGHYLSPPIYSTDGKTIVIVSSGGVMGTYNIVTGKHLCSYTLPEGYLEGQIWTHGECIQFATMVQGSISIWEVGFGPLNNLLEVKTFLLSDKIPSPHYLRFFLSLSQLASINGNNVLVWDAQNSEPLLDFWGKNEFQEMTFSSDGHFFACITREEFYLWKESSVGYTLHQNFTLKNFCNNGSILISPNGESIILSDEWSASLWHTRDPITSFSSKFTKYDEEKTFLFEVSTDKTVAAVERGDGDFIILDLKSGDPQLVIDINVSIEHLRVTQSMVVAVCDDEMIAWDIPAGGSALNARANTNDSVHTTTFDHSPWKYLRSAISPDLKYVAFMLLDEEPAAHLSICDTWTGERSTSTAVEKWSTLHFTPDSHEIWCIPWNNRPMARWAITKERDSNLINLECLEPMMCPLKLTECMKSSCGYEVVDDCWILSSTKKRLLWLPHDWQSRKVDKAWRGQFYKFSIGDSSEFVLLECLE